MREMIDTISAPFFATDKMGWLTRTQRSMYLVKFLGFFENECAIYTAIEYPESGNLADYLDEHSRMRGRNNHLTDFERACGTARTSDLPSAVEATGLYNSIIIYILY